MISAIDCGAGPGGMAIRLAEKFSKVEAFDLSEGFVEMATAKVQELKITNLKVYQDDAMEMMKSGDNFDLVLGCNFIDRVSDPLKWLELTKQKVS